MRKIIPLFFSFFILLTFCSTYAQSGNIWYFGKSAGLSFNTRPLTPLVDGKINSLEGNATISDEDGKLLFYSNGIAIFNSLHEEMVNGTNLNGHISSCQAVVILPKPGDKNIFYVFTSDALENDFLNGYNYHIVDMRLDGGRGAVVSKNNLLYGGSSERLTTVTAGDHKSYWVITNEGYSNVFKSYRLDCSGLNTNPVVSVVGRKTDESAYSNIGVLRVSPNGKYLVQTNLKGRGLRTVPSDEYAQLFDFDNNTGVISNSRVFPLFDDGYYFGAEFSPNSQFLYLVNTEEECVHQFDVSSGSFVNIYSTRKIIRAPQGELAAIALGPDEKIYLSTGTTNLHVINDPNKSGQNCNLVMGQQLLNGRSSQMALPNINPNFYTDRPVDFTFTGGGNCSGLIQFTSHIKLPGVTLSWDFGDGEFGTGPNPVHDYKVPNKQYYVKLKATDNLGCIYEVAGKILVPSAGTLKAGFSAVMECNQLKLAFTDTSKYSEGAYETIYHFGDGTSSTNNNPIHIYPKFGTYTVMQISTALGGCIKDTVKKAFTFTKPTINAGPDITATSSDPLQLNAKGGTRYHWEPSTYLSNPDIGNPLMTPRDEMTYEITGYNSEGCSNVDMISIKIAKSLRIDVPSGFVPKGSKNNLLRPLLRLIDRISYFRVYNRWGQIVFETTEIGKGWDGTINGEMQPSGTYTWMLEVVDFNGVVYKKIGASVLIR